MNEKLNLFNGPTMIASWYEGNELCECEPPWETCPTSDYKTHEPTCPLRNILEKRHFERYTRIYLN